MTSLTMKCDKNCKRIKENDKSTQNILRDIDKTSQSGCITKETNKQTEPLSKECIKRRFRYCVL